MWKACGANNTAANKDKQKSNGDILGNPYILSNETGCK
jgi:hypothetical protein